MTDGPSISDVERDYRAKAPVFEALAHRAQAVISDLLLERGIEVAAVEARAKTVESFLGKVRRKQDKYSDPLREITDLAGIRIVTYYAEDVVAVRRLLQTEFVVYPEHSGDKAEGLAPDQFGYLSDHLIVSLGATRKDLAEWRLFADLRFEIQVRTVTQHAWAAIEHKLRYKSTVEVPDDLRRRLSRLSALFELADEQFSALRQDAAALTQRYADALREGDVDVKLDASSFEPYLETSAEAQKALEVLGKAGFFLRMPDTEDDQRQRDKDRADLLKALLAQGIETTGQLDEILKKVPSLGEKFIALRDRFNANDTDLGAYPEDLLNLAFFVAQEASEDEIRAIYNVATTTVLRAVIADA